jgi:thymidylate synthase (FAD)
MTNEKKVHNAGFVKLLDVMGDDLKIVNVARVSFGKKKDVFDEKDYDLMKYLVEHGHHSPFRHCKLTFHVKAPIFVMRQWMKHRIDSEFNEISGRYVDLGGAEFFVPEVFRKQAKVNKQGSEGFCEDQKDLLESYLNACETSLLEYNYMIANGVCREQARCVLPLALYTEVHWTCSLQALANFLHLRLDSHAQKEIQDYAQVCLELAEKAFPVALPLLMENGK